MIERCSPKKNSDCENSMSFWTFFHIFSWHANLQKRCQNRLILLQSSTKLRTRHIMTSHVDQKQIKRSKDHRIYKIWKAQFLEVTFLYQTHFLKLTELSLYWMTIKFRCGQLTKNAGRIFLVEKHFCENTIEICAIWYKMA